MGRLLPLAYRVSGQGSPQGLLRFPAGRNGDLVPGLSAGVPDLLQLLQPPPAAQAAGLQAHLLLRVPAADEDQPEGPALPLVPWDHQATSGVLCVTAAR